MVRKIPRRLRFDVKATVIIGHQLAYVHYRIVDLVFGAINQLDKFFPRLRSERVPPARSKLGYAFLRELVRVKLLVIPKRVDVFSLEPLVYLHI